MAFRLNALIGAVLVAMVLAAALLAAVWTPYDPMVLDLKARLQPPSTAHWLGTDEFGRDVLSRLISGAGTSFLISLLTVAFAMTLGTFLGVVAGFLRGWVDRALMMLNDTLLAFPGMLLALGLMVVVGASKYAIVVALGLA
ncbi:MAG TPA: ABC transporter permease, partial [Kiloniellaceae bacterium]